MITRRPVTPSNGTDRGYLEAYCHGCTKFDDCEIWLALELGEPQTAFTCTGIWVGLHCTERTPA